MTTTEYKSYAFPIPSGGYYDDPLGEEDVAILRSMARRVREISEDPVQEERRIVWKKLNGLEKCRIPVLIRILDLYWPEIFPWKSTLKTKNPWARLYEDYLFKRIWHWENLNDDYITEPVIAYDTAGKFGSYLTPKKYVIPEYNSGEGAYRVEPVLDPSMPPESVVTDTELAVDWEETNKRQQWLEEVFDGILAPRRRNPRIQMAFFDWFCEVRGMENALTDLVVRPAWVHDIFQYLLEWQIKRLHYFEKSGALVLNNREECYNGGHSHTDELPRPGFDGRHVRSEDIWGLSAAQAAVSVSPDMHSEFVTRYEAQYLKEFGLNTIACCETVDNKMHLHRQIPNLRRVSVSTFNNFEKAAKEIGTDYVYSFKPRADYIARDEWNPDLDGKYLDEVLNMARGCRIEIVNQEMITCRGEKHRLIEWCDMARKAADRYS